ncbi:MAG: SDR family oxidoreductase [Betaproteobacteria bacterium]|nr:SDR family oxidoreductase [Betaproteobacteria bacterium]
MTAQRDFRGKVVVVTGAAGGLGRALVHTFLQAGAQVAALDRDAATLASLASELGNLSSPDASHWMTAVCDVTRLDDCEAAITQVSARFGGVDVLINNAGIAHRSAFADTQVDVLRRVMDVNFFGAVHCTHAALPSLRQRAGMVIAISSVAGFAPLIGRTGYAASKHALHGFFDSLRTEVQDDGVDVLIVCPSFIDTGIDRAALGADGRPAAQPRTTTGKTTQPAEVAVAILHAAQRRRQRLLFGFTAQAAWWLSRLWPTRYAAVMRKRLRAEIFPANSH